MANRIKCTGDFSKGFRELRKQLKDELTDINKDGLIKDSDVISYVDNRMDSIQKDIESYMKKTDTFDGKVLRELLAAQKKQLSDTLDTLSKTEGVLKLMDGLATGAKAPREILASFHEFMGRMESVRDASNIKFGGDIEEVINELGTAGKNLDSRDVEKAKDLLTKTLLNDKFNPGITYIPISLMYMEKVK